MSDINFMLDGTTFAMFGTMLVFFGYLMYWGIGMWYYHEFLPWLKKKFPCLF